LRVELTKSFLSGNSAKNRNLSTTISRTITIFAGLDSPQSFPDSLANLLVSLLCNLISGVCNGTRFRYHNGNHNKFSRQFRFNLCVCATVLVLLLLSCHRRRFPRVFHFSKRRKSFVLSCSKVVSESRSCRRNINCIVFLFVVVFYVDCGSRWGCQSRAICPAQIFAASAPGQGRRNCNKRKNCQ
jgi:hypothetical protein